MSVVRLPHKWKLLVFAFDKLHTKNLHINQWIVDIATETKVQKNKLRLCEWIQKNRQRNEEIKYCAPILASFHLAVCDDRQIIFEEAKKIPLSCPVPTICANHNWLERFWFLKAFNQKYQLEADDNDTKLVILPLEKQKRLCLLYVSFNRKINQTNISVVLVMIGQFMLLLFRNEFDWTISLLKEQRIELKDRKRVRIRL